MKIIRSTPTKLDYCNPFMKIHHTRADFGRFEKEYFVIDLGPRVGIVAMKNQAVLLTRQFRFLIDGFSWELPGGRVDEGETPESAAIRECLEETGIECSALTKLVEYYPGLDNFDNRTTVFFSEETRVTTEFRAIESEVLETRWTPVDEALRMVMSGKILDALTVVGLLAFRAVP